MHNSNNKSVQQMITVQTIQDKLRQKPGVSASIQFYDMADRYFLTIGAYHQELSDSDAKRLLSELQKDKQSILTTKNNHPALLITKKNTERISVFFFCALY